MELSEMTKAKIKVMEHFVRGGEVEYIETGFDDWRIANDPSWDWYNYDYRIKEETLKIVIEKWLLHDIVVDVYFECMTSDIDKMLKGDSHNTKKIKLIESYEVEL